MQRLEELSKEPDAHADYAKLLDMLIPLGKQSLADVIRKDTPGNYNLGKEGPEGLNEIYTCRHLQADGNCGIYDERPQMCRNFPDNSTCNYKGCTSSCAAKK